MPLLKEQLLGGGRQNYAVRDLIRRDMTSREHLGLDTNGGLRHDVAIVEFFTAPNVNQEDREVLRTSPHEAEQVVNRDGVTFREGQLWPLRRSRSTRAGRRSLGGERGLDGW